VRSEIFSPLRCSGGVLMKISLAQDISSFLFVRFGCEWLAKPARPLSLRKARVVTGLPLNATDELGAT